MLTVSIQNKSYFGQTILLIVLATITFLAIREFKILPDRLFSDEKPLASNNIVVDSMALEAMDTEDTDVEPIAVKDTMATHTGVKTAGVDSIAMDETFDPTITVDGYHNLKRFYAKLHELENDKTKKVRVAYFGDSMNDGDFIVQDVRSELQDKFGGQGVGFVAISSLSASARGSISHQYSKNWLSQSFVTVKKPKSPFGIDGQVFFTKHNDQSYWVKYRAQKQRHSTSLYNPTLFYGRSDNNNATISIQVGKEAATTESLHPSGLLNVKQVSPTTVGPLQVSFHNTDSIPIYGFNFDDGQGVHVDNFSVRGNSGLPLSILNPALMNAFDRELGYDLIVLHYGANVLGYGTLDYRWYERSMTRVIENLRQCFPNADILVISTADRAKKEEAEMVTDPAVIPLARAQKSYARKNGAGYINLYNLMGGSGSMVTWVNNGLAGKDYTHFNAAGSRKVAKMIYTEIEKGYTKYKGEN